MDTLVINALRIEPHMSHLSLDEALEIIKAARPRVTYLTHMSHGIGPEKKLKLPQGVYLAYDENHRGDMISGKPSRHRANYLLRIQ